MYRGSIFGVPSLQSFFSPTPTSLPWVIQELQWFIYSPRKHFQYSFPVLLTSFTSLELLLPWHITSPLLLWLNTLQNIYLLEKKCSHFLWKQCVHLRRDFLYTELVFYIIWLCKLAALCKQVVKDSVLNIALISTGWHQGWW